MSKQSTPFIHTNDLRGASRLASNVQKDNMRNAYERAIICSLKARYGKLACFRVFGISCRNSHKKSISTPLLRGRFYYRGIKNTNGI